MKILRTTYFSLGTNLGDKLQNLQNAVNEIAISIGDITALSPVYQTKSWGFEAADFLNIAIKVQTAYSPEVLLEKTQHLELKLGRAKLQTAQYESRIIDIDILLYGNNVVKQQQLEIPHPYITERDFVIVPLLELNQEIIIPKKGELTKFLNKNTNESSIITKI